MLPGWKLSWEGVRAHQLSQTRQLHFFGWFTFLQTIGMAEGDLKTSAHLLKHPQEGSPNAGHPAPGQGVAVPIKRQCRRRRVWGNLAARKRMGQVWPVRANWLCQAGTALAWHNFSSSRTTPWRRDVSLCFMTSLLPKSRGFAWGRSPDLGSMGAILVG